MGRGGELKFIIFDYQEGFVGGGGVGEELG